MASELTGGLYECASCGYIVELTDMAHLRKYGVRSVDRNTALFRCPYCYYHPEDKKLPPGPNTFYRIGFWRTLKYVAQQTWRDAKGG